MGAAGSNQVGRAAFASVQREILRHDPDRQRATRRELVGAVYRLPKPAQKAAGQSLRTSGNKIVYTNGRRHNRTLNFLPQAKARHTTCPDADAISQADLTRSLFLFDTVIVYAAPSPLNPLPLRV